MNICHIIHSIFCRAWQKNNDIFNYIIHEILLHFKLLCPNEWRQLPFISGLHLNIELCMNIFVYKCEHIYFDISTYII